MNGAKCQFAMWANAISVAESEQTNERGRERETERFHEEKLLHSTYMCKLYIIPYELILLYDIDAGA